MTWDSGVCESCGQTLPGTGDRKLITDQELNVLSAWWHFGGVRATANFFGVAEQTVKNQLMDARRRNGIHTTPELARAFMGELRTMNQITTQHNIRRKSA